MTHQPQKTVASYVTEDYRTADVFKKYGIDFCCGGKVPLYDICQKKQLSYDEVVEQLEQTTTGNKLEDVDYENWEADKLVNHIIQKHHHYVTNNIDIIGQYAAKVARVHGDRHPEVKEIDRLFQQVSSELLFHLQKEEIILFPFIMQLAGAKRSNLKIAPMGFGPVKNPISMMEAEHDEAGHTLHEISRLSNQYTPPQDACNSFKVLYAKLKEFEDDLHTHVHLENNILFPKTLDLYENYALAV